MITEAISPWVDSKFTNVDAAAIAEGDKAVARAVRLGSSKLSSSANSQSEFLNGMLSALAAAGSIRNERLRRATVSYISNLVGTSRSFKNDTSSKSVPG